MVRLHPACLRKSAPARRLVSGRHDGIRTVSFQQASLRQPVPDLVSISGASRNVAQAVGCKEGRGFARIRQPLTLSRPKHATRAGCPDERRRRPLAGGDWHGLCSMRFVSSGTSSRPTPSCGGWSTGTRVPTPHLSRGGRDVPTVAPRKKQRCEPLRMPGAVAQSRFPAFFAVMPIGGREDEHAA